MAKHPPQIFQVGDILKFVTNEDVYVEACRREYIGEFGDEPENVYSVWLKYPFGRTYNIPESWLVVLVNSKCQTR